MAMTIMSFEANVRNKKGCKMALEKLTLLKVRSLNQTLRFRSFLNVKLKLKFRKSTFESEQFFRLLGNLILHLFCLFRFQFQIIQKLSPYLNRLFRSN